MPLDLKQKSKSAHKHAFFVALKLAHIANRFRDDLLAVVFIAILATVFMTASATTQRANAPIPYQGRLMDTNYVAKPDASTYRMKFAIYNALSGGSCLWATGSSDGASNCSAPASITGISVARGLFTVLLGSGGTNNPEITSSITGNFNSGAYYLGVTQCGSGGGDSCDAEMSPRKQLGGTFYSYNSDFLDGNDSTEFPLQNTGRSGGRIVIGGTSTTDDLVLRTTSGVGASGADMIFQVGNNGATEAMRISNSGYVGIGTTTPTSMLYVDSADTTKTIIAENTSDAAFAVGTATTWRFNDLINTSNTSNAATGIAGVVGGQAVGGIAFQHNGTTADSGLTHLLYGNGSGYAVGLTLNNSGYVGIGTTAPESGLVIQKNSAGGRGGELSIVNYAASTVGNEAALNFGLENSTYGTDNGNAQIKAIETNATNGAADMAFTTWSGSVFGEKMRITSDGNVGIGTTGPKLKFDVAGNAWIGSTSSSTLPDGNSSNFLVVGDSASTNYGEITVVTNQAGTANSLGGFNFANYALGTTDKRIGAIFGYTDGATNSGQIRFYTASAGTLSQQMVIDKSGNVGIGTTDPSSYKLNVNGSLSSGAITSSGNLDLSGGSWPGSGPSAGHARIYGGTTTGFTAQGNGSSYDIAFANKNGNDVLLVPTGTVNVTFGGSITATGVIAANSTDENGGIVVTNTRAAIKLVSTTNSNNVGYRLAAKDSVGISRAAGYYFVNGTTDATTYLGLSVDDSAYQMVVDRAGNVGIGTTTPGADLHIVNSANQIGLALQQTGNTSTGAASIYGNTYGLTLGVNATSSSYYAFSVASGVTTSGAGFTGGSRLFYVQADGKIGIGTDAPSGLLHIASSAANDVFIDRADASANQAGILFRKARGTIASPTVITSGDYLGYLIGRGYSGSAYTGGAEIDFQNDGGTISSTSLSGRILFLTTPDGTTTPAERMRIDSAGNVGIGATTPGALLDIYDSASISSRDLFYVRDYLGGTSDKYRFVIKNGGNVGIGTAVPNYKLDINGTLNSGALTATTGTFSGVLSIDDTTDSTSGLTGSVHTDGGLGVVKSVYIGSTGAETLKVRGIITPVASTSDRSAFVVTDDPAIYATAAGGTAPFNFNGHLVLQPRTSAAGNIYLVTGMTTPAIRMIVNSSGNVTLGSVDGTGVGNLAMAALTATTGTFSSTLAAQDTTITDTGGVGFKVQRASADPTIQLTRTGTGVQNWYITQSSGKLRFYDATGTTTAADLTTSLLTLTGGLSATTGTFSTSVSTPSIITAAGALGITPAAGSNVNISLSTTGDFAVNTNQLYADTSTGNVGIGSTTPGTSLDIAGNSGIYIDPGAASSYNEGIRIKASSGGYATIALGITGTTGTGANVFSLHRNSSNDFEIRNNTSTVFYIKNGGNVGIGTTSPGSKLEVNGEIIAGGQTYNGISHYQWEGATYRNPADFSPSILIRQDNATTGINGFKPALSLYNDIGSQNGTVGLAFVSREEASAGNAVELGGIMAVKESAGASGAWSQGGLDFFTKNNGSRVDAMYIASGGNVGIGTTSPQQLLHISKAGSAYIEVQDTTDSKIGYFGAQSDAVVLQSSGNNPLDFYTNGSSRIRIDGSGNVGIGTTAPSDVLQVAAANSVVGTGEYMGANLVYNGGGENGINGWTTRDFGVDGSSGSGSSATTTPFSGSYDFYSTNDGGLNQQVTVIPGATYTLGLRMKVNATGSDSSQGYLVVGTTSTGRDIADKACNPNDYDATPNINKWVLCSTTFTAPSATDSATTSIYVGFRAAGNTHAVLTDNVSLVRGGLVGGYSPLTTFIGSNGALSLTGNVGIGNTAPGRALVVGSSSVPGNSTIWSGSGSWEEGLRILAPNSTSYAGLYFGSTTDADYTGIEWGLGRLNSTTGGAATDDLAFYNRAWTGSSLSFAGRSDVQMWFDRSTGNTAFGGNVGIGTISPNKKLEINTANGVTDGIRIGYNAATSEGLDITYLNSGATTSSFDSVYNNAGSVMNFRMRTAGTAVTAMTILGSGNVGVGATTPTALLHVNGAEYTASTSGSSQNSDMRIGATTTNLVIDAGVQSGSPAFSWIQSRSKADYSTNYGLSLNPNGGDVGIDTTSPTATLHVKGSASTALTGTVSVPNGWTTVSGNGTAFTSELSVGDSIKIASYTFTVTAISSDTALTINSAYPDTSASLYIPAYKDPNLFSVYNANAVNKFIINKSGNIGAGTTSNTVYKLAVNTGSSAATYNDIGIGGNGGWSTNEEHGISWYYSDSTAANKVGTISMNYDGTMGNLYFKNFYNAGNQTSTLMMIKGNGNVGIGTTNPFTGQLHVNKANSTGLGGDLWITNTGTDAVGSSARLAFGPDASTDSTPNAGIENIITNSSTNISDLAFKFYDGSGYNEKMRIKGDTGYVGVGTTDSDDYDASSTNVASFVSLDKTDANTTWSSAPQTLMLRNTNTTTNNWIKLGFGTNDGTNTVVSSAISAQISGRSAGNWSTSNLTFHTSNGGAPTEKMRIDSLGNVGIGAAPTYNLDVQATQALARIKSTTSTNPSVLYITGGQTVVLGVESSSGGVFFNDSSSYNAVFGSTGNYGLQLGTSGYARMTIDSSGNIGIGQTSPRSTTKLDVAGPSVFGASGSRTFFNSNNIGFNRDTTNGNIFNSNGFAYQFQKTDSTTNTSDLLALQVYNTAGTSVTSTAFVVNGAGNISMSSLSGGGTYYVCADSNGLFSKGTSCSGSDIRLKKNITELSSTMNVLDSLKKLRGVYFNWDTSLDATKTWGDDRQVGMIAQEVEAVFPELVGTGANGYKVLQYDKISAFLVEVAKAQQAQIDTLKNNSSSRGIQISDQYGAEPFMYVDKDGNVGIGTQSPTAALDVKQKGDVDDGIGKEVFGLSSAVTGGEGPNYKVFQGKAQTDSVTPTNTIHQLTVLPNNLYSIEAKIIERNTTGNGGAFTLRGAFKTDSSNPPIITQVNSNLDTLFRDNEASTASFNVTTNGLIKINVSGDPAETNVWHSTVFVNNLGN